MELTLEDAVGIPENCILSLKIGESRRQGPAAKPGSLFRFGCKPAAPLNAKVELLAPVALPQTVLFDPTAERWTVDLGGERHVVLRTRELGEPKRTKVDVNKIMDARRLPSEKLQMAQSAARYLDEHDIVQTFQDILHGLLLERPEDPFAFIDERVASARALAAQRRHGLGAVGGEEERLCSDAARAFVRDVVSSVSSRRSNTLIHTEVRGMAQLGEDGSLAELQVAGSSAAMEGTGVDWLSAASEAVECRLGDTEVFSSTSRSLGSQGSPFGGHWLEGTEVHTIHGTELRWANGICTDVEMTGDNSLSVVLYGKVYDAHLEDGGRVLHWCDGDIWQRAEGTLDDSQPIQVSGVEALLGSMHSLKRSLPMVLPALPQQLREQLQNPELVEECHQRFSELDLSQSGKLAPQDLLPVLGTMSCSRQGSITEEQCQRFAGLFDANMDGVIEQSEFANLVRFSLIAGFLESEEGQEVAGAAMEEDRLFNNFLRTLEEDVKLMGEVVPLLPAWLQEHLESAGFKANWMERFDTLDKDGNGVLDPAELLPEVLRLSEAHPLTIDFRKCRRFAEIFDRRKDGVIRREEWLELAKALSVMCYLAGEEEESRSQSGSQTSSPSSAFRLQLPRSREPELLRMLEEDRNRLSEVVPFLPDYFKADIMSDRFVEVCSSACQKLDPTEQGVLDAQDVFPLLAELGEEWDLPITRTECQRFTALFCGERNSSSILLDEVVHFARFALVMALLRRPKELLATPGRATPQRSTTGFEGAEQLLRSLQADAARLGDVVAFLPMKVKVPLLAPSFAEDCLAEFDGLDGSSRGALVPEELLPAAVRLGRSKCFPADEDQFREFLGLLSMEHSAAIRRGEFVSFVQFLLALAFFETSEGKAAAAEAQHTLGVRRVEELLAMLERDRHSVHKVVPLLPHTLAQHLASNVFARTSNQRFVELDAQQLGYLQPSDLGPLVAELSLAHPSAVDGDACQRFIRIFDTKRDGMMDSEEFLELSRFLCIMSFLHTEDGRNTVHGGIHLMDNSFKVDDLRAMLRMDPRTLQQALECMPGWIRNELEGEQFDTFWTEQFEELDAGESGRLEHRRLSDAVMAHPVAQYVGMDTEQYVRHAAIFDDTGFGVITKAECPDFVRFVLVLAFLESQDGRERLEVPVQEQHGTSTSLPPADNLGIALHTRSICANLEHYRIQAARLELENEAQREHIMRIEVALRQRGEASDYHAGHADLHHSSMQVPVG